jgi:transposase InsO family protein
MWRVDARGSDGRTFIEAFPWDSAPRYLIRDRDTAYGPIFRQRLHAMGIRDKPTAPRSPWQNPYVERLIGTIRRECLDHMIVLTHQSVCIPAGRRRSDCHHQTIDDPANNFVVLMKDGTIFKNTWLGFEGIVSKRMGSPYSSGRSPHWLKSKNPDSAAVRRETEEDWGR